MSLKLEDVNLYDLLGVDISAKESEIKKAYRKKALQCHPDKNPDNPKAGELFHQLSKALEILCDVSAKAAYDKVLRAKEAAKLRHRELDSKRQKLKDDLDRREREAELKAKSYQTFDYRSDKEKLEAEIIRLQKEGSKLLEEEHEKLRQEIAKDAERLSTSSPPWDSSKNRIKIRWSSAKIDDTNGGYNVDNLRRFLKKYGDIVALVISPKKKGSALVEFSTKEASQTAIDFEKGLPENPLKLSWLNGNTQPSNSDSFNRQPTLVNDRDYESLVLRRMRQAAERQKLIDQMLVDEGAS